MNNRKTFTYLALGILVGIALLYALNSLSNKSNASEDKGEKTSECSLIKRKSLGIKPGWWWLCGGWHWW